MGNVILKPLIVLKIGTNLLTQENGRINFNLIFDIVDQIARLKDKYRFLLVSSGAVETGKHLIRLAAVCDPLLKKQMLASIGQGKIYSVYSRAFAEKATITAQALLTKHDFRVPEYYNSIKNTLTSLIDAGVLPIVNENDVVNPDASSFGDNDQLCAIVACLLQADKLIILTDIGGLYTADPKIDPKASLIKEIKSITPELTAYCQNTMSSGGTGGMYSKLRAAGIATGAGIPVVIANGGIDDIIHRVLTDTFDGTYFHPATDKKKSIKTIWMKNLAEINGFLVIDDGAERALKNNKSLLAVGICETRHAFQKGDVLIVKNTRGHRIAVGLAAMGSRDFSRAKSTSADVKGKIVIHKNHLYLL